MFWKFVTVRLVIVDLGLNSGGVHCTQARREPVEQLHVLGTQLKVEHLRVFPNPLFLRGLRYGDHTVLDGPSNQYLRSCFAQRLRYPHDGRFVKKLPAPEWAISLFKQSAFISAGCFNLSSSYLEADVVFSTELAQFLLILVRMELALVHLEEPGQRERYSAHTGHNRINGLREARRCTSPSAE